VAWSVEKVVSLKFPLSFAVIQSDKKTSLTAVILVLRNSTENRTTFKRGTLIAVSLMSVALPVPVIMLYIIHTWIALERCNLWPHVANHHILAGLWR